MHFKGFTVIGLIIINISLYGSGTPTHAQGIPVGLWFFNEPDGTTAYDSSGDNRNATIYDAHTAIGVEGNALLFSGNGSHVSIPNSSLNDALSTSYSFSLWFKSSTLDQQVIISKGAPDSGGLCISIDSTTRTLKYCHGTECAQGSTIVTDNKWHHISAVYDSGTMQLSVFLDGEPEAQLTVSVHLASNDSTLYIGKGYTAGLGDSLLFFNGYIDNVQLYKGPFLTTQRKILFHNIILPQLITIVANDNINQGYEIDDDDFVTLTFANPTYPFQVDASNIDFFFPLLPYGHSWLSGSGEIGPCIWSPDSTRLTVYLSVSGGSPSLNNWCVAKFHTSILNIQFSGSFGWHGTQTRLPHNRLPTQPSYHGPEPTTQFFLPNGRRINSSATLFGASKLVEKNGRIYQVRF